jgi:hypothetical protein
MPEGCRVSMCVARRAVRRTWYPIVEAETSGCWVVVTKAEGVNRGAVLHLPSVVSPIDGTATRAVRVWGCCFYRSTRVFTDLEDPLTVYKRLRGLRCLPDKGLPEVT